MPAFQMFDAFVLDLAKGVHQLHAAGHTLKVYATNAAPSASADAVKADLAEISAVFGYPSGGTDVQNDATQSAGFLTVSGVTVVWTASGGDFGPFRYVVLYNDTATGDPLIGWWDLGSSVTIVDTKAFTSDFEDDILFTLELAA